MANQLGKAALKNLRIGLSASLMMLSLAGPLQAQTNPGDSARATIRELGLQDNMPDGTLKPPPKPLIDDRWLPSMEQARFLLWAAVIAGILVLAYSLRDSLPLLDRSRRIVAANDGLKPGSIPAAMREAQVEADELARLGRFVEAMHVLLLQSLAEMRRRLNIRFADSLTSREILHRVELPEAGRISLGSIIQQVERTYFGHQGADEADYRACRQNFDALTLALSTGPAA